MPEAVPRPTMVAMTVTTVEQDNRVGTGFGVLMLVEAASLAVMATLHLTGTLDPGSHGAYQAGYAGIAEAIIGVVLLAGALTVFRAPGRARPVAVWTTAFAVLGFALGISITIRGGQAIDIGYHATVLPILLISLVLLVWPGLRSTAASRRR